MEGIISAADLAPSPLLSLSLVDTAPVLVLVLALVLVPVTVNLLLNPGLYPPH